ncbi:MAG: retroviral-like aspartic protease family protein [Clostridiales bacterium]|jgi:predicted aspartyl protease|nr:retroviral-like aspartic protease family protein [Clostridiales bacterium]
MKTITIDLKMYGNLIVLEPELWKINSGGFGDFTAFIDTGASRTTIDKEVLHRAGYDVESGKKTMVTTAGGLSLVNEIVIEKLRIEDLVLENLKVYAHTFPSELFISGLIGLDILSQFDVNFLFSKDLIEFTEIVGG